MIWIPILLGGLVVLALISEDETPADKKENDISDKEIQNLKRQRNQIQRQLKKLTKKSQEEKETEQKNPE